MKSAKATLDSKRFTSHMNTYKSHLAEVAKDLPVLEFKPLRSWPVAEHPRKADMEAFSGLPSQYK